MEEGIIDEFKINIPWSQLNSQNIVVQAKGLHVKLKYEKNENLREEIFSI